MFLNWRRLLGRVPAPPVADYPPPVRKPSLEDGSAGGAAGAPGSEGGGASSEAARPAGLSSNTEFHNMELAKATPQLSRWEPVAVVLNPHIRPALVGLIDAAEVSLCVTQCYLSDEALVRAMVRAVRDRNLHGGNRWPSSLIRAFGHYSSTLLTQPK